MPPPLHPPSPVDRLIWPRLRVLARCTPQDKYLLVSCLKQLREQANAAAAAAANTATANSSTADTAAIASGALSGPEAELLQPLQEVVAMTGGVVCRGIGGHTFLHVTPCWRWWAGKGVGGRGGRGAGGHAVLDVPPLQVVVTMTGEYGSMLFL